MFSAGLIYLSQILLARWMGSFEFGIYVYVWTLVLLIGDLADLGLATAAQRFIPEYTRRKARSICCAASCRAAAGSRSAARPLIAAAGVLLVQLLEPYHRGLPRAAALDRAA